MSVQTSFYNSCFVGRPPRQEDVYADILTKLLYSGTSPETVRCLYRRPSTEVVLWDVSRDREMSVQASFTTLVLWDVSRDREMSVQTSSQT